MATDITNLVVKIDSSQVQKANESLNKLDNTSKKVDTSTTQMGNSFSATTLKLGGALAGFASLSAIYEKVLKNGIAYNSLMEDQLSGLTALTVATTSNISSTGRALTLEDKYNLAKKESIKTLEKLRDINQRTPQQLAETLQIYKTLVPTLGGYAKSQDDILNVTELLAKASAAYGLEFQQLLSGVDGLATGTVEANSELGRFLKTIGLSNEALKGTDDVVGLITEKLKPLGGEIDTLSVANSNLTEAWDSLTSALVSPFFDDIKESVKDLTGFLNDATVSVKKFFDTFKDASDLDSIAQLNKRVTDVYEKIENKQKQLDNAFDFNKGKYSAELRALNVELLDATSQYGRLTTVTEQTVAVKKTEEEQTKKVTKVVREHKQAIKEKKEEQVKEVEVIMTSSQAWQEYFEKIGDYQNAWLIEQADLYQKYSDLTEEELSKILAITKKEYFDKFKKEAKDSFDFNIDLDGLDSPVSKMLSTMNKVNDAQEKYNKYIKQSGLTKEQIAEADDKNLSNQIKGYSNLSGAIAGMFEAGSKEAATFQIAQTTLALVEGTRAILTAGTGDPYTAIPRMIAMGAMVSSLLGNIGVAFGMNTTSTVSDSFSSQTANNGSGSVLGDVSKQSESIVNAMGVLEEFAKPQYQTLQSMNNYLETIATNIGGVTSLLIQQGGFAFGEGYQGFDTGFKNTTSLNDVTLGLMNPISNSISKIPIIGQVNNMLGGVVNSVLGGVFGKTSVSQSMTDSGIYFADQLLKDAIDSFSGSAYQTISTTVTKKSWFSKSSSTSINSYFSALDAETNRQFSLVLKNIYDTVLLSGDALDTSSAQLQNSLNNFVISIGKISLKDKTGTEIQEILTNVFGKVGDDIVKSAFPLLTSFQQVGEGMFETLTRVSTGMEEAEFYIERLGKGFTDVIYTDIINKQGNVGFEALLQSIVKADEASYGFSNNLVDIITNLDGTAEELYSTYVSLDNLREALKFLKLDTDAVSYSSIRGAGSIDALSSGVSAYIENFLTDQEQLNYHTTLLAKEFEKLNIEMPSSKEAFTDLIESLDLSTESGQELYGRLIVLSDGFSSVSDEVDSFVSILYGVSDSIKNVVKDLRGTNSTASLSQFNQALQQAFTLSGTNNYEEFAKAVDLAIGYSSALQTASNFSSEKEMAFAKSVAANQFEELGLKTDTQISVLQDIRNNTGIMASLNSGITPTVAIPAFANGGIVTSPTVGLIGEAGYNEAIIPLDGRDNFGIGILVKTVNAQSDIIRQQNAILNTHSIYLKDTRDLTNDNYMKLSEIEGII